MTVVIDCRMADASGIGVYLRGILPFFLQSKNELLLMGESKRLSAFTSNTNVEIVNCNVKPFSFRELFFFPKRISKIINTADIFYSPFFNIPGGIKIPVFTTIHDMVFHDMPELTSKAGLIARKWFYRRAYKKSKKIFTVSNFSKSRIMHHLGTEKPIIVTYSAIQPMYPAFRDKYIELKKTKNIVFIGNIKKHKGLDCLLDAFLQAKAGGLPHKLVIIGAKDNFRTSDNTLLKKIETIGGGAVSFSGFISDEQLMEILSTAALLVQPSLYEGFCLPPLEAMVLGAHALVSDIPVLKEVYADYPVTFFKAADSKDLKEKMIYILNNLPAETVILADHLVNKYTFKKTVSIILKEMQ